MSMLMLSFVCFVGGWLVGFLLVAFAGLCMAKKP
jgi:hypothetical protein